MSRDLNTLGRVMAEAYERGGHAAAAPVAEAILARVGKWYLGTHPDALYLRARVRHVLSQAAADRGDHAAAREHVAAGFTAVRRAARLRDPRVAFETVLLLTARADLHLVAGDRAAALADYDAALATTDPLGHPMWWEGQVHARLGRGSALQEAGDLDGAERETRTALAVAAEHEPRLVSLCLDRLALLRRLAGAAAGPQAQAAEAIAATQLLDATRRAERARHAASLALEQGDADAAGRHLADAEQEFLEVGDERRAAAVAAVRAEAMRLRGDLTGAVAEAERAAERCRAVGDTAGEAEAYTVLGLALDDAGRSADALAAHDRARALVTGPAELVRVDVRRAVAAWNAAVYRFGETPGSAFAVAPGVLDRAIDIAVPCALAADAIRFGMPAGELRETWAREVSGRIVDSALQMLTVAHREEEILDLLEHVAASAVAEPLAAADHDRDLLAVPPRVRSLPGTASPIGWALDAVPERYGITARTDEEVDAW
ncbi:hypothetical protein ACFQHV_07275 [Promicromonospora thailandica]|uniref:Tetratricopeptide repeat protein n=1 Tax=Promicromonospora thailandica TaxID=765201 RepID=A0A9X2G5M5_9MICO|nr:hypothetical protein [Promicromonospora thailandica]MCP2267239.1 hypothetical protein [Promicromonospora thailandica]BFF17452.1 hypothetical protein GCM10025730_09730 [Promicromonospora thailandica]